MRSLTCVEFLKQHLIWLAFEYGNNKGMMRQCFTMMSSSVGHWKTLGWGVYPDKTKLVTQCTVIKCNKISVIHRLLTNPTMSQKANPGFIMIPTPSYTRPNYLFCNILMPLSHHVLVIFGFAWKAHKNVYICRILTYEMISRSGISQNHTMQWHN